MADLPPGLGAGPVTGRHTGIVAASEPRTPVFIVCGPGQSDRTALFQRIARDPALRGVVVLADRETGPRANPVEDAEPGVDAPLAIGCVCCAVRGDLQRSLRALLSKARRGDVSGIIIDAAARTDPVSILTTLIADPVLAAVYRVGGVVAEVDPSDDWMTDRARRQVIVADSIIIPAREIAAGDSTPSDPGPIRRTMRALNPAARIAEGLPDAGFILAQERFGPISGGRPASAAVVDVELPLPLDWEALSRWLAPDQRPAGSTTDPHHGIPGQVLRVTGVIRVAGEARPVALEVARHRLAPPYLLPVGPPHLLPVAPSRLVFMGKDLDAVAIRASLDGFAIRLSAGTA